MRYKVTIQKNTHLRVLPTQDTEHIPRLMHAEKLRVHADPPLPQEEVQMLVRKRVARSPNVTTTMEGKVKRLLGRRDQRVYLTWLEQKEKDQIITQPRLHKLQQEFDRAPLEERRRLANQARMEEGLDTVPWRDLTSTGNLTTTRSTAVTSKKTSK